MAMININIDALKPLSLDNSSTNNLFFATHNDKKYLVKFYVGANKESRQQAEMQRVSFWIGQGFNVPKLHNSSININAKTPYSVFDFIEGDTLMRRLEHANPF